eukprot:5232520-Prymnesium_polylepis.1
MGKTRGYDAAHDITVTGTLPPPPLAGAKAAAPHTVTVQSRSSRVCCGASRRQQSPHRTSRGTVPS